ncbi:MAG: bifunctional alpha,alpha-trehalose-phosphate synthase (UDP-forming)/trehalose-phosphatase [Candidatus Auribacterota bacterium]|nr:bifunctional alpha,alpha-trehalose-phosphate synthase (UDP-forming)/trehalose-phosphatase [Candidatus Auribacterota bacterium]
MSKLIMVSNRLPTITAKKNGTLTFKRSAGGLATGLASFYKQYESVWIGWPGMISEDITGEEKEQIEQTLLKDRCYPVFLSKEEFENYYYGFCNKTIWPLFHYFPLYTTFNKEHYESYVKVNRLFCDEVLKIAEQGDTIWVHDYQLLLLPKMIRERMPEASIGFFLHIPFPSSEVFRLLPWRNELLAGIMGANVAGFHTYNYVKHFLNSARYIFGYDHDVGRITMENHLLKVDAFPMGIDYARFADAACSKEVKKEAEKIRAKLDGKKIILSIDRLDYTKGIAQRLEAFDLFLDMYPEYKGVVTLLLVAVPSRTGIDNYMLLKKQLDELIGRINGKHGSIGWVPIWYFYRGFPFKELIALYSVADVALVTPLRDGMNLIAKEYIASKINATGVLILSETAGAVKELGEALVINPNNKEQIAQSIHCALTMSKSDQLERNVPMQKRLLRYNVTRWANDFMEKLSQIRQAELALKTKKITPLRAGDLLNHYSSSSKRLIFLDYDGTLVDFKSTPSAATPDKDLISILGQLCSDTRNELVIISGRDRESLEKWFGKLDIGLVAEHGAWVRERNKNWKLIGPLTSDWKAHIRPLLEVYVDRTPGSLIEEKTFSLVWHYRKVDPELAGVRVSEMTDALLSLTVNRNLDILEGNKVLEIKKMDINKGNAARRWILKKNWDFMFGIGDDWTDEDLFKQLPEYAYSIKVGMAASCAKFNIESVSDVRALLSGMVSISNREVLCID